MIHVDIFQQASNLDPDPVIPQQEPWQPASPQINAARSRSSSNGDSSTGLGFFRKPIRLAEFSQEYLSLQPILILQPSKSARLRDPVTEW